MSSSLTERAPPRDAAWPEEVADLRCRIDAVNLEMLRLLERRAELALEVGRLKQACGLPLRDAQREFDMLAGLVDQSRGLLNLHEIERVFGDIFETSRSRARRP
jgi:chorismate mutase